MKENKKKKGKPKNLCKEPECYEMKMPDPNKKGKFKPYCENHAVLDVLRQLQKEREQYAIDMEIMRQNKKNEAKKGYHNALWKNYSRYSLLVYADENLRVTCSTNPDLSYDINDSRLCWGHYFRTDLYPGLKYEFKNGGPQSRKENNYFSGNQEKMAEWIDKTHGAGTIEWLESIKNNPYVEDYKSMSKLSRYYAKKINEEFEKRGKKNPWNNPKY